jgi:hypothetical protein
VSTLIPLLAQATQPAVDYDAWRLTPAGWTIMLLSVGFVTGLLSWCIYRVMRESTPTKVHSQIDIEPKDVAE